jgi:hypothetical protein
VKNDWQYDFIPTGEFTRESGITINLKDGSSVTVGPFSDRRVESARHSKPYRNLHLAALGVIDPILKDAASIYSNKSGLCFREILVIAKPGTPSSETQAFAKPRILDCSKLDCSKFELRKIG